jgi:hypothetical protein
MFRALGIYTFILFVLFLVPALQGQESQDLSIMQTGGPSESSEEALEIIDRAEAKLYSPIDAGLEDVSFTLKLGLNKTIRTFWLKQPDKMKAIFGLPKKKTGEGEEKPKHKISAVKPMVVEMKVREIVTCKVLGHTLGKPISCFKPFGHYQVVNKDENGFQIRFNMTPTVEQKEEFLYTHIDFYLDSEYRLTKIIERFTADGRMEEHRIRLKPLEEGGNLLAFDEIDTILGAKNLNSISLSKYHYDKMGPYWMLKSVDRSVPSDEKTYHDEYLNIAFDQGLADSLFE